jgi:hypothetical protein
MSHVLERDCPGIGRRELALYLIAAVAVVMVGCVLVCLSGIGVHAEFLQSAGLVPSGASNWFSGMTTAVKNADGEMSLAAVAMTPVAASVIGWSHYSGSQQSHKHAGRALAGLVVLLAVAPHIAS